MTRGGASRFFYCAKPSPSEKEIGLEHLRIELSLPKANRHPTVKSIKLMTYLLKLVTPPGGIVLDPFSGSGTTGIAAVRAGYTFLGIEKELEYATIARGRIAHWASVVA